MKSPGNPKTEVAGDRFDMKSICAVVTGVNEIRPLVQTTICRTGVALPA